MTQNTTLLPNSSTM